MQRPAAEPAPLGVDEAELDIGVTHTPVAAFRPLNANRLADQYLADTDTGSSAPRADVRY